MERKTLGMVVITFDILVTACSVFIIWFLERHIGLHVKNYTKLTLETREFGLTFSNFPVYHYKKLDDKNKIDPLI